MSDFMMVPKSDEGKPSVELGPVYWKLSWLRHNLRLLDQRDAEFIATLDDNMSDKQKAKVAYLYDNCRS